MKQSEITLLHRLYRCLQIPKAAVGGANSSSVKGFVDYSKDASFVIDKVNEFLRTFLQGEDYIGHQEELIVELEEWHKIRKSENWGRKEPSKRD